MPQSGYKTDIFTLCHNFLQKTNLRAKGAYCYLNDIAHVSTENQQHECLVLTWKNFDWFPCWLKAAISAQEDTQRKCCETPNTTGGSAGTADQQLSSKEKHGQCLVQENKCSSINTAEAKTLRLTKIAEQQ